ncbi:MAG: HDOD domain-containing protein [Gemmatirosa sp.]
MLNRLLGSRRDTRPGGPAGAPPPPTGEHAVVTATAPAAALSPLVGPTLAFPDAPALAERCRAELARVTIALRERYPINDHAERLLVKLAVDLEMAAWQPSAAAQEALGIVADPDGDPAALVRALERDAALARGLLRHAGCALYAGGAAPATVEDAVRRLGAKGVQVAVLAGMAESLLQRTGGPYQAMAQQVWGQLVQDGPRARAMARAFGIATQEAFLLGLVHDVGKLVLFDLLSALHAELRRDLLLPSGLADEALDLLHEPIGGLALLRWGVDVRVAWAVAHHHRRAPEPGREPGSELLYVVERVHAALRTGRAPDVEAWWREGALETPVDRVCAGVAQAMEQEAGTAGSDTAGSDTAGSGTAGSGTAETDRS